MGPQQALPIQVRVDLGVIAIKRYSTFFEASRLDLHHQMQFIIMPKILIEVGSYSSTEMQSMYVADLADRAC